MPNENDVACVDNLLRVRRGGHSSHHITVASLESLPCLKTNKTAKRDDAYAHGRLHRL